MNENRVRSIFPSDEIELPESYRSFRIPSTATRPSNPKPGTLIHNSNSQTLEAFVSGTWITLSQHEPLTDEQLRARIQGLLREGSNVKLEAQSDGTIQIHVPMVGDYTTAENIGQGVGLYRGKQGTNLLLRRLQPLSDHIQIKAEGDTITFDVTNPGEPTLGRSLGKGVPVYAGKNAEELLFRSLSSDDSLTLKELPQGMIEIGLGSNLKLPGDYLALPSGDMAVPVPGAIRFNPTLNAYEGAIHGKWARFGTDLGTFLPLIGGTLTGLLYPDGGMHLRGSAGLTIEDGSITDKNGIFGISFADGGRITTGLQGTIDGFRFPAIAALYTELDKVVPGVLRRVQNGFESVQFRGTDEQIILDSSFKIGLAENPVLPGSGSVVLPSGSDQSRDQRPGAIRYHESGHFEACYPGGWEKFATTNQASFSRLDVEGDAFISGKLNGRDLTEDARTLVSLDQVRGLVYRGPNGLVGARVMADPDRPGIHIADHGEEIQIGLEPGLVDDLTRRITSQFDQEVVRSGSLVHGRIIDGRDLVRDGMVIDAINAMEPGIIATTGNGVLVSQAVVPSVRPEAMGLSVDNSTGSGPITLGLRLAELPEVTDLNSDDWVIVSTAKGNGRISIRNLIAKILMPRD